MRNRTPILQRIGSIAVALIMGWAAIAPGSGASEAPSQAPAKLPKLEPVTAQVLTGGTAWRPGEPLTVGVFFRMDPGWHIYWRNPGDSGLPTLVEFHLPDGFEVGALRWPVPERFGQPGGIVGYGYPDSVLLFAEITPPYDLSETAEVSGHVLADWLCCREVCIPGRAELDLTMPIRTTSSQDPTPDGTRWSHWRSRLPGRGDQGPFQATVTGQPAGDGAGHVVIDLAWSATAPAELDWFPAADPALAIESTHITRDGNQHQISFDIRVFPGGDPPGTVMESIVAWTDPLGQRRGHVVVVPLSETIPSVD